MVHAAGPCRNTPFAAAAMVQGFGIVHAAPAPVRRRVEVACRVIRPIRRTGYALRTAAHLQLGIGSRGNSTAPVDS
jgi:hypothetical protein